MEKFQRWIIKKNVEWAQDVEIFCLLGVQWSLIRPQVKDFLHAITSFNLEIIESVMQRVSIFIIIETVAEMLNLLKISINKLLNKPTKEKEREKDVAIYRKITPLEALINRKGWKVSLLNGMYATRLLALIQVIWLKGSRVTYVVKKIDELCGVGQVGGEVNTSIVVFNNLYNKCEICLHQQNLIQIGITLNSKLPKWQISCFGINFQQIQLSSYWNQMKKRKCFQTNTESSSCKKQQSSRSAFSMCTH